LLKLLLPLLCALARPAFLPLAQHAAHGAREAAANALEAARCRYQDAIGVVGMNGPRYSASMRVGEFSPPCTGSAARSSSDRQAFERPGIDPEVAAVERELSFGAAPRAVLAEELAQAIARRW